MPGKIHYGVNEVVNKTSENNLTLSD